MSKKTVEKGVRPKLLKVMVFGTFDGLHQGHINFFKQARKLVPAPFLIVSIARDKNVFKVKGKYSHLGEHQRAALVRRNKLANKIVLAGIKSHLPHIVRARPDIIALGYDQRAYVPNLKKDLKGKGILVKIVRLKPYKKNMYKNHLLKIKNKIK